MQRLASENVEDVRHCTVELALYFEAEFMDYVDSDSREAFPNAELHAFKPRPAELAELIQALSEMRDRNDLSPEIKHSLKWVLSKTGEES